MQVCCPQDTEPNHTPKPVVPPVTEPASCTTLPAPGVCGKGSIDRIYGGNKTRIDEFPWMALIEYTKRAYKVNYQQLTNFTYYFYHSQHKIKKGITAVESF